MPNSKNESRRFYLVCKKSFWGKLSPQAGFWSHKEALDYTESHSGKFIILRKIGEGDFEVNWKNKPE